MTKSKAPLSELSDLDTRLLRAALSLARDAMGSCYPNPAVGCVIARGAEIIGFAATGAGGVPHAEPQAIEMARAKVASKVSCKARAKVISDSLGESDASSSHSTSLYVTLEPCAHAGKTPPCVEAIIAAGIPIGLSRVIYGLRDPDARTNGKGSARLRAAGIEVIEAPANSEISNSISCAIAESLRGHCKRVELGLPFCTLKLAISLDGKISATNPQEHYQYYYSGDSESPSPPERTLISGRGARSFRNDLLRETDAVMIGARTMRCDDPRLLLDGCDIVPDAPAAAPAPSRNFAPIRVLLDGRLTIGLDSKLFRTIERAPLWIITRKGERLSDKGKALSNSGVRFIDAAATLQQGGGVRLSLRKALASLATAGVASVLCEGGARLAQSLFREGLVDRLILFCANRTLGAKGLSMLEGAMLEGDGVGEQDFILEDEIRLGAEEENSFDRILTLRPRPRASNV